MAAEIAAVAAHVLRTIRRVERNKIDGKSDFPCFLFNLKQHRKGHLVHVTFAALRARPKR